MSSTRMKITLGFEVLTDRAAGFTACPEAPMHGTREVRRTDNKDTSFMIQKKIDSEKDVKTRRHLT